MEAAVQVPIGAAPEPFWIRKNPMPFTRPCSIGITNLLEATGAFGVAEFNACRTWIGGKLV